MPFLKEFLEKKTLTVCYNFCYVSLLLVAGDPSGDTKIHGDPFKTIFVGRIVSECVLSVFLE